MGLDVGDRRIGVAVSDASKMLARPLCIVDRQAGDAIGRLRAIAADQCADELVVGLPYHAAGGEGQQAGRVRAFVDDLIRDLPLPVTFADERYTSAEAQAVMRTKRKGAQPKSDDALAASLILQRALDERRAKTIDPWEELAEADPREE
jgi:putative Holliday junction resolvase